MMSSVPCRSEDCDRVFDTEAGRDSHEGQIHTDAEIGIAHRQRETLQELYVEQEYTIQEIADKLGASYTTIHRQLEKHSIETRDTGTGRRVGVNYQINKDGYPEWQDGFYDISQTVSVHRLLTISEGADPHRVFGDDEYHVHHKNGLSYDNRPDNVEVLHRSEHMRLHHTKIDKEQSYSVLRKVHTGSLVKDVAEEYGVAERTIYRIRTDMNNQTYAGRMIADENVNTSAVVKGIKNYEMALAFHQEAHKHDVDSDVKEAIAEKLRELDK